MNDKTLNRQAGASLVLVLVVLSAFSVVAVHQGYLRHINSEEQAFHFTVAQAQYTMNLVNAYRSENGSWPSANNGNCRSPHELVGQQDAFANGWGWRLVGENNCNNSYQFIQFVPARYENRLQAMFSEDVSFTTHGGVPSGYRQMQIEMNVASIAEQEIHVGQLSSRIGTTGIPSRDRELVFEKKVCPNNASEVNVVGLDGGCGRWVDDILYIPAPGSPQPRIAARGYRVTLDDALRIQGWRVGYDFMIHDEAYYYSYSEPWTPPVLADGYEYADEDCPYGGGGGQRIKALLLSWCENN